MSPLLIWDRSNNDNQPLYSPYRSENVAAGAQAVNRSSMAALAFLVWDILITFDDEVQLIWSRSWSYPKYVYYLARYLPLLVEISILFIGSELTPQFHFTNHDCYIWGVYQAAASTAVVAIVDTILILRVHALYHGHRIIRLVVACCYVFEIAGMILGMALALPGVTYDNVCLVVGVPRTLIIYGGSTIIFQFLLFVLTLYKFILAIRSGWGDVPLIVLLMRDGTWAFFLLFAVYVGQLGLYKLSNDAYAGILFSWQLTFFSFCGYHILINLSRLAEHMNGAEGSRHRPTDTNLDIQFSTQLFDSQRNTTSQEESYELSQSQYPYNSRIGKRTVDTSQISTISLGK